jgi:hypothetical protein
MASGKLAIALVVSFIIAYVMGFFWLYQPLQEQHLKLETEHQLLANSLHKTIQEAKENQELAEANRAHLITVFESQYKIIADEFKQLQQQQKECTILLPEAQSALSICESNQIKLQSQLDQSHQETSLPTSSPSSPAAINTHADEVEASQSRKINEYLLAKLEEYRIAPSDPLILYSRYSLSNFVNTLRRSGKYQPEDILFSVITSPLYHETRAIAAKESWARRAHKVLFVSSAEEPGLPTISIPNSEATGSLAAAKVLINRYPC